LAAWTGLASARYGGLHIAGGTVDVAIEVELQRDVGCAQHWSKSSRRAIRPSCRSSGVATDVAHFSDSPRERADTLMVGKSTCGNGATGSNRNAITPDKRDRR
jgi:hypothetical protein